MVHKDLFGVYAHVTGLHVYYDMDMTRDTRGGTLEIIPKWSKIPKHDGYVCLVLDEETQDVVPELIRESWDALWTTDPGYYVPRWIRDKLSDYEAASHY